MFGAMLGLALQIGVRCALPRATIGLTDAPPVQELVPTHSVIAGEGLLRTVVEWTPDPNVFRILSYPQRIDVLMSLAWIVAFVSAVVLVLVLMRWAMRMVRIARTPQRAGAAHCTRCNYEVRLPRDGAGEAAPPCPECGQALTREHVEVGLARRVRWRRASWWLAVRVAMIVGLAGGMAALGFFAQGTLLFGPRTSSLIVDVTQMPARRWSPNVPSQSILQVSVLDARSGRARLVPFDACDERTQRLADSFAFPEAPEIWIRRDDVLGFTTWYEVYDSVAQRVVGEVSCDPQGPDFIVPLGVDVRRGVVMFVRTGHDPTTQDTVQQVERMDLATGAVSPVPLPESLAKELQDMTLVRDAEGESFLLLVKDTEQPAAAGMTFHTLVLCTLEGRVVSEASVPLDGVSYHVAARRPGFFDVMSSSLRTTPFEIVRRSPEEIELRPGAAVNAPPRTPPYRPGMTSIDVRHHELGVMARLDIAKLPTSGPPPIDVEYDALGLQPGIVVRSIETAWRGMWGYGTTHRTRVTLCPLPPATP